MCNAKRTVLITLVICVGLTALCSASSNTQGQSRSREKLKSADTKFPTVKELLDKCTMALDSTDSFIEHYELTGEARSRFPANHPLYSGVSGKKDISKFFRRGMLKFEENKGRYAHEYGWGDFNRQNRNLPEDKAIYTQSIATKKLGYFHQVYKGSGKPGSATWSNGTKQKIMPCTCCVGSAHLSGYIDADERLDTILRKADSVSLHRRTVKIGDSDCYVIKAQTKYGQYTVWLDPQHGYLPARVRRKAGAGQYTHHQIIPAGSIATGYLDVLKFSKVGGTWVPIEAKAGYHRTIGNPKYYMDEDIHYKRSKIVLDPDHDKLGSFADPIFENPDNDPELMNGMTVEVNGRRPKYIWKDGAVVDADGNKVDLEKICNKKNCNEK